MRNGDSPKRTATMPKLERRNFVLKLRELASAALGLAITLTPVAVVSQPASAQTFKVLYRFGGGADGAGPGNLIIDSSGILYGTGRRFER
jgi:hypothetical protein